jgi:hypothetical protein
MTHFVQTIGKILAVIGVCVVVFGVGLVDLITLYPNAAKYSVSVIGITLLLMGGSAYLCGFRGAQKSVTTRSIDDLSG